MFFINRSTTASSYLIWWKFSHRCLYQHMMRGGTSLVGSWSEFVWMENKSHASWCLTWDEMTSVINKSWGSKRHRQHREKHKSSQTFTLERLLIFLVSCLRIEEWSEVKSKTKSKCEVKSEKYFIYLLTPRRNIDSRASTNAWWRRLQIGKLIFDIEIELFKILLCFKLKSSENISIAFHPADQNGKILGNFRSFNSLRSSNCERFWLAFWNRKIDMPNAIEVELPQKDHKII